MQTYLSRREAARLLRIRDDKINELIESGRLRAINTSTGARPRWRIRPEWLDALADAPPVAPQGRRRSKLPPVPRMVG